MTDLERLIAIEDIKQLQARRVHAVDTKDWAAYAACHSPRMEQESNGERATGIEQVVAKVKRSVEGALTIHHVHSPLIEFTSDTTARGRWVLEDRFVRETGRGSEVRSGYGHYHDTYGKLDGRWVYTSRKIVRQRFENFVQSANGGKQGTSDDALAAEVAALRDRFEIIELPRRYARGVDRKDWNICRDCFTPDAVIDGSRRSLPNRDYFARQEREMALFPVTMHSMHNETSTVTGDTGHVETYAVASHWSAANVERRTPPDLVLGVRYHDDVKKIDGRWFISRRRVSPDWRIGTHPSQWEAATKS